MNDKDKMNLGNLLIKISFNPHIMFISKGIFGEMVW